MLEHHLKDPEFNNPFSSMALDFISKETIEDSLKYIAQFMVAHKDLDMLSIFKDVLWFDLLQEFLDRLLKGNNKINRFLALLSQSKEGELIDIINFALDRFYIENGHNRECYIAYNGSDMLSICVTDGESPLSQIILRHVDGVWTVEVSMIFFELNGSIVELRRSIDNKVLAIVYKEGDQFNLVATGRDVQDAISFEIPSTAYPNRNSVFARKLLPYTSYNGCFLEELQLYPITRRSITIYNHQGMLSEKIDINSIDGNCSAELTEITYESSGMGRSSITYYQSLGFGLMELSMQSVRNMLKANDNIVYRSQVSRLPESAIPINSRIELFNTDIKSFEVVFDEIGRVIGFRIEDEYFEYGKEASMYLTVEGPYVVIIHKDESPFNIKRIFINFSVDYHLTIDTNNKTGMFEVANHDLGASLSKQFGLTRVVSLN